MRAQWDMKMYQQHDSKMCVHKGRIHWSKEKRKLITIVGIVGIPGKSNSDKVYLGRLIES